MLVFLRNFAVWSNGCIILLPDENHHTFARWVENWFGRACMAPVAFLFAAGENKSRETNTHLSRRHTRREREKKGEEVLTLLVTRAWPFMFSAAPPDAQWSWFRPVNPAGIFQIALISDGALSSCEYVILIASHKRAQRAFIPRSRDVSVTKAGEGVNPTSTSNTWHLSKDHILGSWLNFVTVFSYFAQRSCVPAAADKKAASKIDSCFCMVSILWSSARHPLGVWEKPLLYAPARWARVHFLMEAPQNQWRRSEKSK